MTKPVVSVSNSRMSLNSSLSPSSSSLANNAGLSPSGFLFPSFFFPFEEEEERTGIASDVVMVKGQDPATPDCLRSVDSEKSRDPISS